MRAEPGVAQNSRFNGLATLVANLTRSHRLLRDYGFDHVMHGESISNKEFRIFFTKNNFKNGRLGIISSKKVLPKAINRNRAKRLIRETFRRHRIKACSCDVVVLIRSFYPEELNPYSEILSSLFSRVEKRCADL